MEVEHRLQPVQVPQLHELTMGKMTPTEEILKRAEKLQALALSSESEHERDNAWIAFGKLWLKYELPYDLGLKKRREA